MKFIEVFVVVKVASSVHLKVPIFVDGLRTKLTNLTGHQKQVTPLPLGQDHRLTTPLELPQVA
jgi:hypothetical protein